VLCHQSPLLFAKPQDASEVWECRRRCYNFLTSETSIMESWERHDTDAIESWFYLDATCIFALILLEIRKMQLNLDQKKSLDESKNQAMARKLSTEDLQEHNDAEIDNQILLSADVPHIQEDQVFNSKSSPHGTLINTMENSTDSDVVSAVLKLLER
jgi:hypothetical protein